MKKDLIINVKKKYFQSILNESKTVEGRINKGKFQKINKGDLVSFCSGDNRLSARIVEKKIYKSFENMINQEGISSLLPDVSSVEQGIEIYNSFPGYQEEVKKYGCVAFRLQVIK